MSLNHRSLRLQFRNERKQGFLAPKSPYLAILIGLLTICLLLIGMAGCAFAGEVKDKDAILAIIGEAENQGDKGMLAIACGIRNRGTLKGVYGLNATRVKKHLYSEYIETKAMLAWKVSSIPGECEFLSGADHWENINAFGRPYWVKDMVETFRYKDHVFYKEKGK